MRKAAGIMLIILGAADTWYTVGWLIRDIQESYPHLMRLEDLIMLYTLFFVVCAFLLTGGVFCLKRRRWGICFGSALLVILIMLYVMAMFRGTYLKFVSLAGILPVIFVVLRKREWQKSQA